MIKDRHGTLTAPRRDNGTQTKRETDPLCLSFGFTSLGHRARLIAVSDRRGPRGLLSPKLEVSSLRAPSVVMNYVWTRVS